MGKLPLRPDEFESIKKMIARAPFDIEFDGEEIVIRVEHFDGDYDEGPEASSTSPIASVSFQDLVIASTSILIQTSENPVEGRSSLFAFAGILREAARFVESEAEALSPQEWRLIGRAELEPVESSDDPTTS